ncbi:MAG: small ribosomal subunit Rsm22 family protein, partial [Beijerinckiaceae bacterium]
RTALLALQETCPAFAPVTLLDVGAGTGAATLAALDLFPSLGTASLIDVNRPMLALAEELGCAASPEVKFNLSAQFIDQLDKNSVAELVVASYLLVELDSAAAVRSALVAFARATIALVLVEPGTPEGFARINAARTAIVAAGGFVAAPCTHNAPCPRTGSDWCHFRTRVQRSRDHRMLKAADAPFEDEPFAYLAVLKTSAEQRALHRVVGPPRTTKIGVDLPLCGADGLTTSHVPARDKASFRQAKRLEWGDAVPSRSPGDDVQV